MEPSLVCGTSFSSQMLITCSVDRFSGTKGSVYKYVSNQEILALSSPSDGAGDMGAAGAYNCLVQGIRSPPSPAS
jgi:hypothetical protein